MWGRVRGGAGLQHGNAWRLPPTPSPLPARGRGIADRNETRPNAQPQRSSQPHRLGEGHAQDHQGHADGRRGQAAARAGGRHRRPPLRRAHGPRARQPQQARHQQGGRLAAAGRHRQGRHASPHRHDRRARVVRRLQLQHRPPRPLRRPAPGAGRQDGQDPVRGPQGQRPAAARVRPPDPRARRPQGRQAGGLCQCGRHRAEGASAVRGRRVRRRYSLFLRVQVRHQPEAHGAAADPGQAAREPRAPTAPPRRAPSTSTSPTRPRS